MKKEKYFPHFTQHIKPKTKKAKYFIVSYLLKGEKYL